MNMGLLNVRSWKKGKFEDMCTEMMETKLDVMAVTQTTLRGDVVENYRACDFVGKGRNKMERLGGGGGKLLIRGMVLLLNKSILSAHMRKRRT